MTHDEILASLFPRGHSVVATDGLITGTGTLADGTAACVIGITGRTQPGVDEAVRLAGVVLKAADRDDSAPILVLVDSGSQRMSRRDELLGLSETLAHLAKSLRLAEERGHRTIGILYGGSAAGAFIATALACGTLVALPGAHPEVMDLPSMSRVTKLSVDVLEEKAKSTPVFAPGLDNLFATGAIVTIWDPATPLDAQLDTALSETTTPDPRSATGLERGGRPKALDIANEVQRLAMAHG